MILPLSHDSAHLKDSVEWQHSTEMPSSERRKKRRSENQLKAELLEAHEWAVTACSEAFQLPDSEIVICEFSDSNNLHATAIMKHADFYWVNKLK